MERDARVCPYCGEQPGSGVFCAACGRNLSAVERLPTRADWETQRRDEDSRQLAAPRPTSVSAFLESMHAAGDPGITKLPTSQRRAFGRQPQIEGWIVRPVARDDEEQPSQYEPGLLLSADGTFHRVESEVRGWGQRDFPQFYESANSEPIAPSVDDQLLDELAGLLRAHAAPASGAAPEHDG
jgi:hypothetical protein